MKHALHRLSIALGLALTIYACGGVSSGGNADCPGQGGLTAMANPGGASAAGEPERAEAGKGGGGGDAVGLGTIEIVGDTSWRTYGTDSGEAPPTGWNTAPFDDSSWVPSVAPNPAACGTYEPTQAWERVNEPMWDVSNKYSAFFRKVVTLPEGATVSYAKITSFADDDIEIWVNGAQAFVEDNFGVIVGGDIEPHEIDLKPFLLPGANLIAIHAQDTIGGCRWAIVSGSVGMSYPEP